MNITNYLLKIYGYDAPIFLKDVRIGGKSKTAIREAFYRAAKRGELTMEGNGVYYIKSNKEFGNVITFEEIVAQKFIYPNCTDNPLNELFIEGYYSGLTFVNMIGISQQVPAILEVTTNRTSSKKRIYAVNKRMAYIRKGRTEINFQNWKILQFLDMFHFVSLREVKENKKLLRDYIQKNKFSKQDFTKYIKLYGTQTIKKIKESGLESAFL